MRIFSALAASLLAAASLQAASKDELKRACEAFKNSPALKGAVACLADVWTLDEFHPIVQTIVPGGGVAMGAQYKWDSPRGSWHRIFTAKGAISLRDFWMVEPRLVLRHPKFGGVRRAEDQSFQADFYLRGMNLARMPFYGIGPNTSRANLVDFRQRDLRFGASAQNPVATWLGVGASLEVIRPDIAGVHKGTIRPIDEYFSEATAPGLASQPTFVHSEIFLRPHHKDPFEFDWRIGYNFYNDTRTGQYSFQRFRADLRHNIYPFREAAQPLRDRVLSVRALLSTTNKGASNAVPFYLQETLGGSDIHGDPMLRGFADYRFRAPNLLYFSTQYEHRVWQYFGLLGFYDTGQVANRAGDLSLSNMRHSYGFGINLWVESKVIFRAYVGLGSGEGIHNFVGLNGGLL